jgi:hypothetical protein
VLAIVAAVTYVAWELGGPFRVSDVSVARTTSEGTVDGFIIMASGKGSPPEYSTAKVNSVVLVDSERDPHFRINVTLWDGQDRELKVYYVIQPLNPDTSNLPDRATQIRAQLARTQKDRVVSVQLGYEDVSWLRRKDLAPPGSGVKPVPVSIVKQ